MTRDNAAVSANARKMSSSRARAHWPVARRAAVVCLGALGLLTSAAAQLVTLDGTTAADTGTVVYYGELDGEQVKLTFATFDEGSLTGVISGLDAPLWVSAERRGARIDGELNYAGIRLPMAAAVEGDGLRLRIGPDEDGETLEAVLRREGASRAPSATPVRAAPASGLVVNRQPIGAQPRAELEARLGIRIEDGTYWYDSFSGWWGYEGGPAAGQLVPGLPLGGELRADASGSGTGVFINGREIHPIEVQQLQLLFGQVPQMRFWLNAQGIGGPEGGPATFSLQAAAAAASGQGGQAGQGVGPGTRTGPFGTTGGDGECFYFNDPSTGASVMTGNC